MEKSDRRIYLDGVKNIRDLGGLETGDGRAIRSGCLYRSATLHHATAEDTAFLELQCRLTAILDLRTDLEVLQMPDQSVPGATWIFNPIFNEGAFGITHEIRSATENRMIKIPEMESLYAMMVTHPDACSNLGRALRTILTHDYESGSILWHCTEGKDRCGLTSALILEILGVPRETIMEDYLITNETNAKKAEGYYHRLLSLGEPENIAEIIRDTFLAKSGYLHAAWAAIDSENASFEEFLENRLGIPPELVAGFREKILMLCK